MDLDLNSGWGHFGSRFSGFDLKSFFNSLTAFVIFEFWKSFDIGQFGIWEPFAFSCLCISIILILMKGRPGRRRSGPFSRRHEELFNQDLPTDGPPLGLPPPITLFNTRAVHPLRCTSQTINATAPLNSQFTVAPNATSPAHSTNSSSSLDSNTNSQPEVIVQTTHCQSGSTAVRSEATSPSGVPITAQTAAEFLARPESLRASSAPAPKTKESRRHKRRACPHCQALCWIPCSEYVRCRWW